MAGVSVEIDDGLVRRTAAQRGLFLRELAVASGIGVSSVYAALGSGRCGLRVARGISRALGLKPSQVIKPTTSPQPSEGSDLELSGSRAMAG